MSTNLIICAMDQGEVSTPGYGPLYTCPLLKRALVRNIIIVNTTGGSINVNMQVVRGGSTARHIITVDTPVAAGASLYADALIALENGDVLQAKASGAGVDFSVNGAVES